MDLRHFERMPAVAAAMTAFPYSVSVDDPIARVQELMAEHGVSHVPVKDAGRVIGIISERDLSLHLADRPAEGLRARDIQAPDPYLVDLRTPLSEVLRVMGERRLGAALVEKDGRLAGIVSITDVCRLLAEVLEARFGGDDEAA